MKNFKNNTPEYILSVLLLFSFFITIFILAIFRITGINYYVIDYNLPERSPHIVTIINASLKFIDYVLIIKILSKVKWRFAGLFALSSILSYVFLDNYVWENIVDIIIIFLIPQIIMKFKLKTLLYSTILLLIITLYQFVMQFAIYEVDLQNKLNFALGISSFIPYKLLILNIDIVCSVTRRKIKNEKQN